MRERLAVIDIVKIEKKVAAHVNNTQYSLLHSPPHHQICHPQAAKAATVPLGYNGANTLKTLPQPNSPILWPQPWPWPHIGTAAMSSTPVLPILVEYNQANWRPAMMRGLPSWFMVHIAAHGSIELESREVFWHGIDCAWIVDLGANYFAVTITCDHVGHT